MASLYTEAVKRSELTYLGKNPSLRRAQTEPRPLGSVTFKPPRPLELLRGFKSSAPLQRLGLTLQRRS
jgi:hypothetical protein